MLNDLSSPIAYLVTRRSARPRDLIEPGPSADELERILAIAARTPDHGKLTPWRFVVVGREHREAFAALLEKALPESDPAAGPMHFDKARTFALQAPALVVLVSAPMPGHKIPVWEQELSCGAAAMNLLHAAHALGYAGGWLTGWAAYSPRVTAAFCEPDQRIAGFLFLGTAGVPLEDRPRPELATVVRRWTG